MPSSYTGHLGIEKPASGEQTGTWGGTVNANMDLIDRYLKLCAENPAGHSGLSFAYLAGRVWDGTTLTEIAAGSVVLADGATNYVEVNPATGAVSANVVGWTAGRIPLFEVVTASGAIGLVTARHPFLSAAGGAGPGPTGNGDVRGYVPGDLYVKAGADRVMVTRAGTITKARLRVATAPTGAALVCDLHLNDTSIWNANQANRVQIAAGATSGSQTAFDTTGVAEGDELRLDVDQVGSTVPGAELVWAVLITPS